LVLFWVSALCLPILNLLAVQNGVFTFAEQNVFGMPFYEYFMWGIYILFGYRHLIQSRYTKIQWHTWIAIVFFSIAFFGLQEHSLLKTVSTGFILFIATLFSYDKNEIRSVLFFIILGMSIEFVGVYFGQWSYGTDEINLFDVPLWLVSFWGGVGFVFYRVITPLFNTFSQKRDSITE